MANTFIKASQVVQAALLLLQREIVLPRLVWTQPDDEFIGALNDTVNLRVPAVIDARTRTLRSTTGLTADDLTETSVPVVLDTHVYSLLNITDEQLTLDIRDFAVQVLAPQMRAIAEGMEDTIADALAGATVAAAQQVDWDPDAPRAALIAARSELSKLNVARGDRVAVLGANLEADLLSDDVVVQANTSGSTDALREGMVTRLFGMPVVGSNAIDEDTGYVFHRTAIAFADVAPQVPAGAADGARTTEENLAMRYVRDYNPTNSTGPVDRSLVDAFVGAASVEQDGNNNRLVVLTRTGS